MAEKVPAYFSTEHEALNWPPPDTKPFVDVPHQGDTWFGVRVLRRRKDGSVTRRWWVRYTDGGGRVVRDMLGTVERGSITAARRDAINRKQDARALRAARAGSIPNFYEAWEKYRLTRQGKWSADTVSNYLKSMAQLSMWHGIRIDRISEDHAREMYDILTVLVRRTNEERKRPIPGRDGVATASAALRLARAIFQTYVRKNVLRVNPCAELTNQSLLDPPKNKRKTTRIPKEKLAEMWPWLTHKADGAVRDYILVGLVLAFRRSIINGLSWDMIDHDSRVVTVPDGMRGNKAKESFRLPIPDWLYENVIGPRWSDKHRDPRWVLPSVRYANQPVRSIRGSLANLNRATGIKISLNDLRRTSVSLFETYLGNTLLCKRLLLHSNYATTSAGNSTTELYVVFEDREMRDAMNKVMEKFLELCDPPTHERWVNRGTTSREASQSPLPPQTVVLPAVSSGEMEADWEVIEHPRPPLKGEL